MELFSDDAQVIAYGVSYLRIILILGFGVCLQFAGERMMQATGNPIWNMYIQASGALINVILDPILICDCSDFRKWALPVRHWQRSSGSGKNCL